MQGHYGLSTGYDVTNVNVRPAVPILGFGFPPQNVLFPPGSNLSFQCPNEDPETQSKTTRVFGARQDQQVQSIVG